MKAWTIPHFNILFLCFAFFSASHFGLAQNQQADFNTVFYTIKDGLPSNEIYDIEEDQYGQMWLCTDNGITRFDGSYFHTLPSGDYSPVVIGVDKDEDGLLWFWTVKGEILLMDPIEQRVERMHDFEFEQRQIKSVITQFEVGKNHCSYSCNTFAQLIEFDDNKKVLHSETFQANASQVQIKIKNDQTIAFGRKLLQGDDMGLLLQVDDTFELYHSFRKLLSYETDPLRCTRSGNVIYVTLLHQVLRIDLVTKEVIYQDFKQKFTPSITLLNDSIIAVGTRSQGLLYLDALTLEQEGSYYASHSVTTLHADKRGNLWIGTREMGLGLVMNVQNRVLKYGTDLDLVNSVESNDKYLVAVGSKNHVYSIERDGDNFSQKVIDHPRYYQRVTKLVEDDLLINALGRQDVIDLRKGLINPNHQYAKEDFAYRRVVNDRDKMLRYDLDSAAYVEIDSVDNIYRQRKIFSLGTLLYFGDFFRAFVVDEEINRLIPLKPDNQLDIRAAIALDGDSTLCGTKGNGIVLLHREQVIKSWFKEHPELNIVTNMVQEDNRIWVSTPSQIYSMELKNGEMENLICWNKPLGIGKRAVLSLTFWKNHLVLFTSYEVLFYHKSSLKINPKADEIVSLNIKTYDQALSGLQPFVRLPYDKTRIEISPKTISYSNKEKVRYRYRIGQNDSTWNYFESIPHTISTLSPGKHSLVLQAQNRYGIWSSEPVLVQLRVDPPFWLSEWFVLLMIALSLGIGIYIYRLQVTRIQRTTAMRIETIEASNKALSLQLNPHFVFNALNSVVATIGKKDVKTAIRFLSKLSVLMRNIFDRSQHQFVSIAEELQAVEQYLELESLRLEKSFQYEINVEKSIIPTKSLIPPLILQPLVENAVWHGILRLKEGKGTIIIDVVKANDKRIRISVKNNGPLLNDSSPAARVNKERISSVALIRRRFELLNQIDKGFWSIELLPNDKGGFESRIFIPLKTS